jgi:putative glutamine amidotransferase
MAPLIGLTADIADKRVQLNRDYHDAIAKSGGIPVILPYVTDLQQMKKLASKLDGLVLTGGNDISPRFFQEEPHPHLGEVSPERDQFEIEFLKIFYPTKKPIFAICRGIQVINVFLGGTLYQDLPSESDSGIQHSQKAPRHYAAHSIQVFPDTFLYQVVKSDKIFVNTYHHQAVKQVANSLRVSAVAPDGVIEGIETKEQDRFLLGVQWHPEGMYDTEKHAREMFQTFIKECESVHRVW